MYGSGDIFTLRTKLRVDISHNLCNITLIAMTRDNYPTFECFLIHENHHSFFLTFGGEQEIHGIGRGVSILNEFSFSFPIKVLIITKLAFMYADDSATTSQSKEFHFSNNSMNLEHAILEEVAYLSAILSESVHHLLNNSLQQ